MFFQYTNVLAKCVSVRIGFFFSMYCDIFSDLIYFVYSIHIGRPFEIGHAGSRCQVEGYECSKKSLVSERAIAAYRKAIEGTTVYKNAADYFMPWYLNIKEYLS